MATVSIIKWRDGEPLASGWGEHAPAQFRRELRRSVSLPLAARRAIEQDVKARKLVTIPHVHPRAAGGLGIILEALGAIVALDESEHAIGSRRT